MKQTQNRFHKATGQSINPPTNRIFLVQDLEATQGPDAVDMWRPVVCLQNISDIRSLKSDVHL